MGSNLVASKTIRFAEVFIRIAPLTNEDTRRKMRDDSITPRSPPSVQLPFDRASEQIL